jgi:hypothetical protein
MPLFSMLPWVVSGFHQQLELPEANPVSVGFFSRADVAR